MFISPTSNRQPAKVRNSKRNSSQGTGFRSLIGSGYARAQMQEAANGVSNVDGILALQNVGENETISERAISRGHIILQELEELKIALLGGQIPDKELEKLSNAVSYPVNGELPDELNNIIKEIELRAKVELAKRGRI